MVKNIIRTTNSLVFFGKDLSMFKEMSHVAGSIVDGKQLMTKSI